MIRHAQSQWNREGRFTGWADPPLTDAGRGEAVAAGRLLAAQGCRFDRAYCSALVRARDTLDAVLQYSGNAGVPVVADWRLNERHYGALQGEDRNTLVRRVGQGQVYRWRRGYRDRPPPLAGDDPRHPGHDPRWRHVDPGRLPNGESLAQTRERVVALWHEEIAPQVAAGRQLLVVSHGNTLRALIMALDDMTEDAVEGFEIPTGTPIAYTFTRTGEPVGWHYLRLGDQGQQAA